MRNIKIQRIAFFLAIISVCLLFSNCRILQKSKSEFTEKQKTEFDSVVNSEGFEKNKTEILQEQNSSYDFSNDKFSELFKLNYQPLFDAEGNIIPLILKYSKNGQTEELFLSGGNLNHEKSNIIENKSENIENQDKVNLSEEKEHKKEFEANLSTSSEINIKDKDKDLKSYDFSFWIYVICIVCILFAVYDVFYGFKSTQSKLKSFIQRVFNGKN